MVGVVLCFSITGQKLLSLSHNIININNDRRTSEVSHALTCHTVYTARLAPTQPQTGDFIAVIDP